MAAAVAVRRAKLELLYKGHDIAKHCVAAQYIDYAEGKVDELSCVLEDRDQKWQGPWWPGKGEEVHAYIQCLDWDGPGDNPRLDCGLMEIGAIRLTGPPDMVDIRAVSARVKSTARTQKKSKAWEDTWLEDIAKHTAGKAGLGLYWQGRDQFFDRVDQREESDLAFLKRLCVERGNSVKAAHEKLIVYEGKKYDARGPHFTLTRGDSDIVGYSFDSKSHDLYQGAVVSYWHPDEKREFRGEFWPEPAPASHDILRINQPVADDAEAAQVAQTQLRKKNKLETTTTITLMGAPFRRATDVGEIKGFGVFDARYFVQKAVHALRGGDVYETELFLRQVIDY